MFFKTVQILRGPLHFLMNFRISQSISTKKPSEIFTGTMLNLQINLERNDILCLLIHEHGISLHFFRQSLISLSNLVVSGTRSWLYFVKFVSKFSYFCYYNKWSFLFQLPITACQHIEIINFSMFTLIPANLINSIIGSISLFVNF